MILDKIVKQKKEQLKNEMIEISIEGWKEKFKQCDLPEHKSFFQAMKKDNISIIGEVKKASPSKGIIKEDFDPIFIAGQYSKAKIRAISVLTEKNFFQGHDDYLKEIKKSFSLPVLRKDFIINTWQIYQSRYLGADAILLIAAILTDEELKEFQSLAETLGMDCLVEVHNKEELDKVLESGAKILGINNRNLKTFDVDLRTTEKLLKYIPSDKVVISESGIKTRQDMDYIKNLGIDGVLIGELFMRAPSIIDKVKELAG